MTNDSRTRTTAFFLDAEPGRRFCLLHEPAAASSCSGSVVFAHAFAEEMNKSRRMAALQCRRLAASGCAVLQIDMHGCGDSEGDFADARWEIWKNDVAAACRWLETRRPGPITLWGMRLGAALMAEVAAEAAFDVGRLVLWQPVVNGEVFMTQFLRQRIASEMLAGAERNGTKALRARLAGGEAIEVSGYRLSPALAQSIDGVKLARCVRPGVRVDWFEVIGEAADDASPVAKRTAEELGREGMDVRLQTVRGEPFWGTAEIAECPALIDRTAASLASC